MRRLQRGRRAGLSLTEVLLAIFVMGIGMISLLTLFPLGALSMGQALRDARATETAMQADGYMRAYWAAMLSPNTDDKNMEAAVAALDDPNLIAATGGTPDKHSYLPTGLQLPQTPTPVPATGATSSATSYVAGYTLANGTTSTYVDYEVATAPPSRGTAGGAGSGKSYPVVVDPLGLVPRAGLTGREKYWVGYEGGGDGPTIGTSGGLLPARRNLLSTTTTDKAVGVCALTDDYTFTKGGASEAAPVRQGRYSWAAVLQRASNLQRSVVGLKVLVFDGRSFAIQALQGEVAVTGTILATRQLQVDLPTPTDPNLPPLARAGGWVMDGTVDLPSATNPRRNANFYRITAVSPGTGTPPAGRTRYVLDIDRDMIDTPAGSTTATLIFFAGLVDVFDRPPLSITGRQPLAAQLNNRTD